MLVLNIPFIFLLWLTISSVLCQPLGSSGQMLDRLRKSVQYQTVYITYKAKTERTSTPRPLRPAKGQYVCGDKLCNLRPGVVPENCNGVCQYPI